MNQNAYLRTSIYFVLTILLAFSMRSGYSKASFSIDNPVPSSYQHSNITKAKQSKFKPFKEFRTKEKPSNLFGKLAIVALVCSLVSLITLSFTIFGGILAALFFIASSLLAYYGTSKDTRKRLAKLTLITNLVVVLSALLSFWIVTFASL